MSFPFLAAAAWLVLVISHFMPSTPEHSFLGPSSEGTAENQCQESWQIAPQGGTLLPGGG